MQIRKHWTPGESGVVRIGEIIDRVQGYYPEADTGLLERAYIFSAMAHQGQLRQTGQPYLHHPLEVAGVLSSLRMDVATIVAGLLHDVPEESDISIEEIKDRFGSEVSSLVEGVTKIGKMAFSTSEERQAENFRKMILAMARDIRVIFIKLADRLHNIKTLDPLPERKRKRIARETMDIYAPLANRLGIAWIKTELEDHSFRYLDTEAYNDVSRRVDKKRQEREKYIQEVSHQIEEKLAEVGISAEVGGRAKHFFSIWRKMQRQNISFDQVYDLIAIRIKTDTVRDCYSVLGTIHSLWTPVPGRFKDYIAMPKANMYQSLHTSVVGPAGEKVEFQIRTHAMHAVAEQGIAAHWKYKEGIVGETPYDQSGDWIKGLLEWQKDLKDPKEFLETVRLDLFPDEVYAFTPGGEVKAFPRGSTPVDFAYSIHSDVGHACAGAKIDGRMVPLRYQLRNGDTVEIVTAPGHKPSQDWLKFVKTSRARTKIRAWIKLEQRTRSVILGRDILGRELKKNNLNQTRMLKSGKLETLAADLSLKSVEELWAGIGYGKISVHQAVNRLLHEGKERDVEGKEPKKSRLQEFVRKISGQGAEESVTIDGLDGMMVRFAKCCNPVPGDKIVGFITRGRGVSVHSADCFNAEQALLDREREIDVQWNLESHHNYPVHIVIESLDRPGILASVSSVIAECGVNIAMGKVSTVAGMGRHELELEIQDLKQLEKVIHRIRKVKGVSGVQRVREAVDGKRK